MRALSKHLFTKEAKMSYFGTLPLKLIGYLLYGVAFKLLWGWFVFDLFSLVPDITWARAFGIGILIRLLGDHYIPREKDDLRDLLWHTVLTPSVAVGVGFLIYNLSHIVSYIGQFM